MHKHMFLALPLALVVAFPIGAQTSSALSLSAQARNAYSRSERAEAVSLAERGCQAGEANGCMLRGMLDTNAGVRVEFHQRGCDLGSGNSCFMLQMAYAGGMGLPKADKARAKSLSARSIVLADSACAANDADACFTAGTLYDFDPKAAQFMGHAVPYDPARAKERYAKAIPLMQAKCAQASAIDCTALATASLLGYGVPKDPARGMALLEASCDGGFAGACVQLGLFLVMNTEGVPKDPKRAGELTQRACDGGEPHGCVMRQTFLSDANLAAMSVPIPPKPKPFKVLRSLAGAAGTFAAVKAVGGTDEEAVGVAAKTVETINPESEFAKALGARGNELLESAMTTRAAELAAKATPKSSAAGNVGNGAPGGASGDASEGTAGPPLVCTNGSEKLRDGYHCMSTPDGSRHVPGKHAVPQIIGEWVEQSAGVCVKYMTGGNATARYKGSFGAGASVKQGKWGIIARKSGAPEPAPGNGWYLFTGALDAQTNLLVFVPGSARPFTGYDFKKGGCPW